MINYIFQFQKKEDSSTRTEAAIPAFARTAQLVSNTRMAHTPVYARTIPYHPLYTVHATGE